MNGIGMSGDAWKALVFFALPLLLAYIGILIWSCTHDRWKR
jgi:hypothetical protein